MPQKWISLDNAKWLLATFAVPLALGYVSYRYENVQDERQKRESRLRLYTELLSNREKAETDVRRGVFDKVLGTYLNPQEKDLKTRLVALELLAQNFDDSIDLSPLFLQLDSEISKSGKDGDGLRNELWRIASEVKDRQINSLEMIGKVRWQTIHLDNLNNKMGESDSNVPLENKKEFLLFDEDLKVFSRNWSDDERHDLNQKRHFNVVATDYDPVRHRISVIVSTELKNEAKDNLPTIWIDLYDFPLMTVTRLSKTERLSLVLRNYDPKMKTAEVNLLYFPSLHSGVKDHPFIDEVASDLGILAPDAVDRYEKTVIPGGQNVDGLKR